jgi:predicted dehydrogenase
MNFLILGDGPDERLWASDLAKHPEHRVIAASPGFPDILPGAATPEDLDGALAVAGVEAVIVGGSLAFRDEALRRSAAVGFASICLHPPGENADPYYQVALSREETGAIVVPDLPGRLHPGVAAIRDAFNRGEVGKFRGMMIEAPGEPDEPDLAARAFPRWVDLARVIIGEVLSLTALGDPPGEHPTRSLTVQLRGAQGRLAEVRLTASGPDMPARVVLAGETGSLTLEVSPGWAGPSRLIHPDGHSTELPPWSPRGALLDVFALAVSGRPTRPNLIDGTRAMELTSAARRSLKRGRSVDLHYEEVSEANNFKTVMTSVGCMVLLGILVALPAALVGPALGIGQTIYIAYAIPPILILFAMLQFLRLVLKPSRAKSPEEPEASV